MKKFIGVKLIEAQQKDRHNFLLHYPEKGEAEGLNEDGYEVHYPDGYVSWSPERVFEEAYRRTDGMTFGLALEALKKGLRVARAGWNGKDMYLFLLPAGRVPVRVIHDSALKAVIESELAGEPSRAIETETHFDALASIRMWTADKKVLTGWLASQTDMLSDDWFIVE